VTVYNTAWAITLLTDEEYLNMPAEPGKHELLDGESISMPPAAHVHSIIARRFYELLQTVLPVRGCSSLRAIG
jgi:Uma2 family endonuclease